MTRKCLLYPTEDFKKGNSDIQNSSIKVYIDIENSNEICEILEKRKKKLPIIFYLILSGKYNDDLYGKENIDEQTKNITAIKFKRGDNQRIYCKEFNKNGKKVVMIVGVLKKSQKLTKKLKSKLKAISKYEYTF